VLLVACAHDPGGAPAAPRDDEVDLAAPELGVQVSIGPLEVEASSEATLCRVVRLANADPIDVIALEHEASPGTHHFNIWGLLAAADEDVTGDCDAVWGGTSMELASPLYASQDPAFYGEFPDGVAATLPAEQLVLLEYHVINTDPEPVSVSASFNAYAAEPGTIDTYANGIFASASPIELPPGQTTVVASRCALDADVNVFAIGSHFHARGRQFDIWAVDAAGERGERVYTNDDWESPDLLLRSDDPLALPAGGGFDYACTFDNDTDRTITQGESADDEMCMMVAIYYPDLGFIDCSA
jgi:hypothetical protein